MQVCHPFGRSVGLEMRHVAGVPVCDLAGLRLRAESDDVDVKRAGPQ